jgi:hypothetical protein
MRTEMNLDKYEIEEAILVKDIDTGDLSYTEAMGRCRKLWELIPINYTINSIRLNELMDKYYGKTIEYNTEYKRTYQIKI